MSTWIKAPGGVLPQKVTEAFASKEEAGPDGVDISKVTALDIASVKGDVAFDDPVKIAARQAARDASKAQADADKAAEKVKKDARKIVLKDLSKIKDKDVQDVLAAIVEELGVN